MNVIDLLRALREQARTNPIGAAREAREAADSLYSLAREISARPEYREAIQTAAEKMAPHARRKPIPTGTPIATGYPGTPVRSE